MLLFTPVWFACVHPTETEVPAADPPAIEVVVRESPGDDSWVVTYTFPEPVAGLWWTRGRNLFRAEGWSGESINSARWGEYVIAESARETFEVRFVSDSRPKPKDYELNLSFSEGSRLLYTGHLRAAAMAQVEDGVQRQDPMPMRWRFETSEGRAIVADGARGEGSLDVGELQDVYVYFGGLEPVSDERVTTLVDPGMPAWMVAETKRFLPEVFSYFAAETGAELDFVPDVLLSYVPGEPDQESYGGGGLHHQMQLAAAGQAWQTETAERRETWLWFLAHEAFHMWNGQMFPTRGGPSEEWLSEGSASYFADRALRDLSVVDAAGFEGAMRERATACLQEIGDEPLRTAHVTNRYRAFYWCGEALMFVTDRQAEAAGSDLGAMFGGMFERSTVLEGWSTYDFLEGIEGLAGDPMAPGFVMGALESGLDAEGLGAALEGAGLAVAVAAPWEIERSAVERVRVVARRLGDCDCGGSVSANATEAGLEFLPLEDCEVLAEGLTVTEVEGFGVGTAEALEALEGAIAAGEPVSLGEVSVSCGALSPLPSAFVAPEP